MEVNDVFEKLKMNFDDQNLGHAFLIETNHVNKCFEDLKLLIKKILCEKTYDKNCDKCNICNLININNLPSLIVVEPEGKNIKTEQIDNLKNAFNMLPIFTKINIYIIKYPEKMNEKAYNKMLKFLEEPEDNIVGFFITENKDNVANTIISRCEILKKYYDNNKQYSPANEKTTNIASEYIKNIELDYSKGILYNNNVNTNLTSRADYAEFFQAIFNYYYEKLEKDSYNKAVLSKLNVVRKCLDRLNYNVNMSLLLDDFVIEMGELDGK